MRINDIAPTVLANITVSEAVELYNKSFGLMLTVNNVLDSVKPGMTAESIEEIRTTVNTMNCAMMEAIGRLMMKGEAPTDPDDIAATETIIKGSPFAS